MEDNFTSTGTCYDSYYTIVGADRCGNEADARAIPVLIDEEDPAVMCGFDDGSGTFSDFTSFESTGSSYVSSANLAYGAFDNCNGHLEVSLSKYTPMKSKTFSHNRWPCCIRTRNLMMLWACMLRSAFSLLLAMGSVLRTPTTTTFVSIQL